jgi:hypothetical protein
MLQYQPSFAAITQYCTVLHAETETFSRLGSFINTDLFLYSVIDSQSLSSFQSEH